MVKTKNINRNVSCPVRWDAHGCPPFKIGSDLSFLDRYKKSGLNFISLNVGFDLVSKIESIELINYFRKWVSEHSDEYVIISSVQQLLESQSKGKLSIAFDLEGSNLFDEKLEMVSVFYALGVRQLVFAYNANNASGGGCFDVDSGLTKFGKELVRKCNDVGMVIDCSHVGYKTSMDIMTLTKQPIVFSHSNPSKLLNHPRNITDEQIITCADTGGVVGINGIGIFLGDNDIRSEKIVEHIDYVAQKVGAEHVGIGMDCIFNTDEVKDYVEKNPNIFPFKYGFDDIAVAQPEQFSEIRGLLEARGYSEVETNNILGENFLRVARSVWK